MTTFEFFQFLIVAFLVARIPVVGKYMKSVNTMFHEDGHALASILTFGKVYKIDLFYNTEGVATTGSRSWLGRVITSVAGYPFASFMAWVFYYFFTQNRYDLLFYGLAGFLVLNVLLWFRNALLNKYGVVSLLTLIILLSGLHYLGELVYTKYAIIFYVLIAVMVLHLGFWIRNIFRNDYGNVYGLIWLLSFIGILTSIYYFGEDTHIKYALMFVGSIMFVESVASALTILILSLKTPNDAGDTTNLRQSTGLSARIWGLLFFGQSLYFGYLILQMVFA